MEFFSKVRAIFKSKQVPVAPISLYADSEFLEVVAKQWKQRYEEPQLACDPGARRPDPARAVA